MRLPLLNLIAVAISVGVVSGLALTSIMISGFAFHSQVVALNVYDNGTKDWTVDATSLLRYMFDLMLMLFVAGIFLGLLITRRTRWTPYSNSETA